MGGLRAWFHLRRLMATPRSHPSPQHQSLLPSPHLSPYLPKNGSPLSSLLRFFSSNPAISGVYESGFVGGHQVYSHGSAVESGEEEDVVRYVPVKAYFLCTSINLKSMQTENACNVIPPTSRSSNYVALRYSDFPPEITDIGVKESGHCYRYVVVFQYGSAVLFNIADHEAEQYLDLIRKHAFGLLPEMRKDDYAVVEKPLLDTWMQGGLDYIVLKSLDIDGIRIIGSVLGQSIALDHYIRQVDDMVEEFTDINRVMEKTGTFTMKRKKLFQLVGKANSSLADVIIKLGLFDRSEIAWKNANYAQILEYLREEYELTQRFGNLDFKLKFVEHNIHFLQEVLQNRRSDLLEWGVIILLTIENIISMYEIIKDSNIVPS
ncbi:protein RETARDED ROOT GROWTH, mitochondrial [Elaeis guineensis]|uniref:protein RETARDED ROOT GROWTH, mitochondrial n=1 Tax=Elaeis guineensis var. tenera TaxID=51953 RepID=UPI003C6D655D